jgi:hypothetical protein
MDRPLEPMIVPGDRQQTRSDRMYVLFGFQALFILDGSIDN